MAQDDNGLQARVQELEKADRAKDQFLALLSHELRNHIHAIRTNVWLIKARNRDLEIGRPSDAIDRQVVRLSRLVDDLLDVIRVTQKSALNFEVSSLQQIVGAAVTSTQETMDSHRREISVVLPEDPLYVSADASRLQQAVSNLLRNAIKYSPQQGQIVVKAEARGGEVAISVKDKGVGIEAAELERIFRLFAEGFPARKPGAEGLGIGLHVARELVEAHGGSIAALSEGPGKGAEFIIRLPLAEAPSEAEAAGVGANGKDEASLSILVVDDNRDAADSLAQVLEAYGHRVKAAYGGEEALELAAQGGVQVALVDIGMPTVDGFQVAERISRSPAARDTLLVAVTGWGEKSDRARSRQAGFAYHLTKPVDFDALASLLATAARRAPAQRP
ncbi:MAG TPA: ATP-binding protein [Usitatibacter sp.]|nr:ATP-binding protein [Usitatibacter sp.]